MFVKIITRAMFATAVVICLFHGILTVQAMRELSALSLCVILVNEVIPDQRNNPIMIALFISFTVTAVLILGDNKTETSDLGLPAYPQCNRTIQSQD